MSQIQPNIPARSATRLTFSTRSPGNDDPETVIEAISLMVGMVAGIPFYADDLTDAARLAAEKGQSLEDAYVYRVTVERIETTN